MAWQAEVPGHGFVEFGDEITQEEAAAAIKRNFFGDQLVGAEAEKAPPTTESSLAHYGTQFAKGLVQPAVSLFKKAALDQTPFLEGMLKQEAEQGIPMPAYMKGIKKPEDIGFFKAGQAIEAQTEKLPEKPELQGSFGSDVAKGIGSSVGFLATGAAMSPVTGFFPGAAIAGAASGGVESYEDAIKHGKTPDEAMDTWAYSIGSTVGLSEVAPIGALFKSLDRVSGGRLKKVLIGAGIEAASEAMQEMFQTGAGNAVAKYYYDQDRGYWDNVARSGGVAAVVGGLVGGGIGAVRSGTSKSRITPDDFSTTPTQPTEPEVNDAAWQRFQEQQRQQGLQTPEGRQREINRIWEQENPQEVPTQEAPATPTTTPPAPVYTGPTSTASLKAELRAPEVPNIQNPQAEAPSMIRSPVHEVLAIQPQDRVQAEWLAETYSKELGRTFHVWDTPNGPRLRLAPQKQELGLEYEQWVDSLEAAQEQEPTSPEAMKRLRADVAANRAAEEYTPAQPEDLKNKILGYNKFNEPVYQWQVDEAQVKMMKGEEIDRERITAVSAEPQTEETSVNNSQRLGYTEQDRLAGRATPEVKADRTQDILGQPSGRVEAPVEAEAEVDPIIEGAPKTLMGKKLYFKRLGPAARNYEISKKTGEITKLYTVGPEMFKDFFSGFEKMPGGGIGTRGWKFLERKALLPYQVMKTKIGGKQIYNTAAQQREDTVGPTINMLLPVKESWQKLSKEEQAEAIQTVMDIEGKQLAATPSNEIRTNADGFVELVPEHLKEFGAFLKNKGFSQPVQEYLLARKKMYNEAFAHKYNTLKNSGRANPTELQDMLQHEGFIPNYFPHNWYGKTYIPGYDADGNLVARVSVGRITEGVGKVLGGAPGIKTLRKELETSKIWKDKGVVKWGELTDASENERYWINAPIPVDAIGRVLDEGAAKLAENPEYEKLAEGFRRALMKDTINVLKSQGFPHYAKRKGILGYEQNDLMGVDFDYIHGLNASLAKMKAAKEFTKLLVETKTDKSDHQLYADFVEDTLGHENSSVDKLSDNIRFVLFMRYLGGSIRSGLINLSAIPAVSTPFLSRISTHSGRLHTDAAASVVGKTRISEPEQRFLGEFSDTLFQAQQMNEFRSRQERTGGTHRLSNWAGKIMEVTESFMRKTTGLATMRAIAEGRIVDQKILEENGWKRGEKVDLSNEENYQKAAVVAGEMVSDVHMDYTRYNKPQVVRRSPALRTMYTFRGYNQHLMQAYINMLKEDGPRGKTAAAASMGMQMALGGVSANMVISALLGAYDWIAKESAETSLREAFPNQEAALDVAFMGMPSLAGMHLGGSFESGIPTSIKEAVGVPFAAWEEVERGYTAWVNGNKRKALEIMIPFKSMANVLLAYREATQGIRTNTGAPVYKPGTTEQMVLEPHEALLQAAGIRPTSKEKAWRASSEIQNIGKYKKEAQGRLASRYTNAIAEEQWDEAEGVLDEIMAWNMTWASKGREELMISMDSLRAAIKSRTQPRKEPKQMRGKAQRIGEAYTGQ